MSGAETTLATGEGAPDTVPITQVPGLPNPFAWWSEDHFLALRPCPVAELPALLETVPAHIRANTKPKYVPGPLYSNGTRTDPVKGDVVRDLDGYVWDYSPDSDWMTPGSGSCSTTEELRANGPLVLLWDGATNALPAVTP